MTTQLKTLSLSLLLALPLAANALERTELLPPNAQNYVRISNVSDFLGKLKLSSLGKLWVDPQFQDFIGNPDAETWKELFFEEETDAEAELNIEMLKLVQGEVVVGFNMEEEFFAIAAMDEAAHHRGRELELKLQEISDDPDDIVKSSFQGVEILQYIGNGGTPEEESTWEAHLKGTLLAGSSREWVEKCIVQLKEEAPAEPEGNPTFSLKLALSSLIREGLLEELKAEASPLFDPEILLDALGLMGIENYSLKIELKDTEMVADSTLRVSDLTKGLFTILSVEPVELPTVTFIPESIASIEVARFDLLRFWQEIPTVLSTAMPTVKPQFDMVMAMLPAQLGINLEQDLLANLGTKYFSFTVANGDTPTSIVALELKDAAAFKTGLGTLLAAPALQAQLSSVLKTEEFLDHTLHTVNDDDPDNAASFGVVGDYLLYGTPSSLRQMIRRKGSDTAASSSYERSSLVKKLREQVPSGAFAFSAVDWKKGMDMIIHEFSKPEIIEPMQQSWAMSGSPLPPPDIDKLPPTDHIASFFNMSYQYTEATGEGIHQRIILKY